MSNTVRVGKQDVPWELYLQLLPLVDEYGYDRVVAAASRANQIWKIIRSPLKKPKGRPKGSHTAREYFWTFVYAEVLVELNKVSPHAAADKAIEAHKRNTEDALDHDDMKRDFLRRWKGDSFPSQARILARSLAGTHNASEIIKFLESKAGHPVDNPL